MHDSRRVAALERRVDSLATTLTAVTNHLSRDGTSLGTARRDTVEVTLGGVAVEGRADAPVTIVEFTDYQCPFCARHARETLSYLRRKYITTGKVRYILRDLPLDIHPYAKPFALAARCVATVAPGAFWAFHDSLFMRQARFTDSTAREVAQLTGVELAQFDNCTGSARFTKAMEADIAEAGKLGLNGTPALIIGRAMNGTTMRGELVRGAFPISTFDEIIGRALMPSDTRR